MNSLLSTSSGALACAAASSTLAFAQVPDPGVRSAVSGLPIAVSIDRPASVGSLDDTLISPFQAAPQVALVAPPSTPILNAPDYSVTKIFGDSVAPLIEIDAHDIGAANLPDFNLEKERLDVVQERRWVSVSASVGGDSIGTPTSLIRRRVNALGLRQSPSADVYTLYLEGSQGIYPFLPAEVFVARLAEEIGLGGVGNDTALDALDYNMGIVTHSAPVPLTTVFFQGMQAWDYYFSLTPNSCSNFSTSAPLFPGHVPTPGHIYHVQWNGMDWGGISVYRSPSQLGLREDDDVDAFAIDREKDIVVFSTQPVDDRSQLLIHAPGAAPNTYYNGTFRDRAGPVAPRFGIVDGQANPDTSPPIRHDNIETVCIVDPEASDTTQILGTWRDLVLFPLFEPEPLGVTLSRYRDPVTNDYLLQVAVSDGNPGGGPHQSLAPADAEGTLHLFFCFDYDANQPWHANPFLPDPLTFERKEITWVEEFNLGSTRASKSLGVYALYQPKSDPTKVYASYVAEIGY
ncbi:MAG: hypothetical protein AAFU73_19665 [Planctomycetota bacterium]